MRLRGSCSTFALHREYVAAQMHEVELEMMKRKKILSSVRPLDLLLAPQRGEVREGHSEIPWKSRRDKMKTKVKAKAKSCGRTLRKFSGSL